MVVVVVTVVTVAVAMCVLLTSAYSRQINEYVVCVCECVSE